MEFFDKLLEGFLTFCNQLLYAIINISLFDIIDIIIVAFIIYKVIEFLRDTRSGQLVKGIALLVTALFISTLFDLVSLKWLLVKIFDYGFIALAIIFQPELRRLLERVGRTNINFINKQQIYDEENERIKNCIDSVCRSVTTMSDKRIGALIVFERDSLLSEIAGTGTLLNAEASSELIGNVFFPKSPLHDGALIIRDGMLYSAGCILPLTANNNLNSQLGTRHRAAIGMSENSDALVVVVSEETGSISIALNGIITRDYNSVTLKEELYNTLLNCDENKKSIFTGFLGKIKKK